MFDPYDREINYLRVSVTDRCNLRCTYCMPMNGVSLLGHEDILRYEAFLRIIGIAARMGIKKVRITGGEPLVRRGVVDFIAALGEIPGLQEVSLTTNGVLLEAFAEPLFRAGIRRINVSLDSLDAEKYARITRGGDLHAVLRGIRKAQEVGFSPLKINIVAIQGVNDDEILDFARLTLATPCQIRFIELMPMGQGHGSPQGHFISNSLIRERIETLGPLDPVEDGRCQNDGPAQRFRLPGAAGEIGFISPVTRHFCGTCNRLRLTADGHLRACLLADEEADLRPLLRAGSDEEIGRLIERVIAGKPKRHQLTCDDPQIKKCIKAMQSIGG